MPDLKMTRARGAPLSSTGRGKHALELVGREVHAREGRDEGRHEDRARESVAGELHEVPVLEVLHRQGVREANAVFVEWARNLNA